MFPTRRKPRSTSGRRTRRCRKVRMFRTCFQAVPDEWHGQAVDDRSGLSGIGGPVSKWCQSDCTCGSLGTTQAQAQLFVEMAIFQIRPGPVGVAVPDRRSKADMFHRQRPGGDPNAGRADDGGATCERLDGRGARGSATVKRRTGWRIQPSANGLAAHRFRFRRSSADPLTSASWPADTTRATAVIRPLYLSPPSACAFEPAGR